jgi:hypothetical protein
MLIKAQPIRYEPSIPNGPRWTRRSPLINVLVPTLDSDNAIAVFTLINASFTYAYFATVETDSIKVGDDISGISNGPYGCTDIS